MGDIQIKNLSKCVVRHHSSGVGSHRGLTQFTLSSRGSRCYFPVFVKGANLSVGDLHFSQGDVSMSYSAPVFAWSNIAPGRGTDTRRLCRSSMSLLTMNPASVSRRCRSAERSRW